MKEEYGDKELKRKMVVEKGWYIPTLHEKYLKDKDVNHQ